MRIEPTRIGFMPRSKRLPPSPLRGYKKTLAICNPELDPVGTLLSNLQPLKLCTVSVVDQPPIYSLLR